MTIFRSERTVRIAAAIVLDARGRVLLVRKRGTTAFMQPGGKIRRDEAPADALRREIAEELGCEVDGQPCHIGTYYACAANELDTTVEAELFAISLIGDILVAAEIEEAVWHDPHEDCGPTLAPLTREHVLPLVKSGSLQ